MAKVTRLTLDNNGELDRRRLNFREISGDADAPLETVGQDLRKAREKRGEELEHISRLLKIRQDYLALLEEGTADALPGRAYAIGFVRSYATYLGLDGNEYVERLKAEIAGRGDNKEQPPPSLRRERNCRRSGRGCQGLSVLILRVTSLRLSRLPYARRTTLIALPPRSASHR